MSRRVSRQKNENKENNENHQKSSSQQLSNVLEDNVKMFKEAFNDDDTVIYRNFMNCMDNNIEGCVIFIDGMVDVKVINRSVMEPLMTSSLKAGDQGLFNVIELCVTTACQTKTNSQPCKLFDAIIAGNTVVIIEGEAKALIVDTKGFKSRAIEDAQTEKTTKGPKESFTEILMTNLSMIRRRLNTPDLKIKFMCFGNETRTKGCICYLEGVAEANLIQEVEKRLKKIDLKGVISTQIITEEIRDCKLSPFRTIGSTEKPDVITANLLEGRVAFMLDGTPSVITMPYLFIENFQFREDYYTNYYVGSINRILSYLGFIISIGIPGAYIAIVCYHQEVLATQLFMSVAIARQGIPFPTAFVALMLLIVFEILKNATARVPPYVSQSLTIVGTLIIGQAAVDARLVGAPMLIIISVSVITRLLLPKLDDVNIIITTILLILSSMLGLYGFTVGIIGLSIHIFNLKSFGRLYISHMGSYKSDKQKDVFLRAPSWILNRKNKNKDSEKDAE